MRRRTRGAIYFALVGLAACGDGDPAGGGGSPNPQPETPSPSVVEACQSEAPITLSSGWQQHRSSTGSYLFSFPANWQDLTGQVTYTAGEVVTEDTLTEAGIGPDTQVGATLVRDPSGMTNLTVFELAGVQSTTEVVYQRQEARIQALPALEEFSATGITACAAGDTALGLAFSFSGPREDTSEIATFYQRSFHVVRDGALYVMQILSVDESAGTILDEVLRTWEWSPAAATGSPVTEAFAEAAATSEVDPAADAPDPATFASTFPSNTPTIHVVFRLQEGVGGDVQVEWKMDGEVVATGGTQTLPDDGTWAYNTLNAPPLGFPVGDYEVELTYVATGETRTVAYTVVEAA